MFSHSVNSLDRVKIAQMVAVWLVGNGEAKAACCSLGGLKCYTNVIKVAVTNDVYNNGVLTDNVKAMLQC